MKYFSALLLLLAILLHPAGSWAQAPTAAQAAVDAHLAPDTARVNRLNALAFEQRTTSPRKSLATLHEALALAQQLNYTYGQAQAWLGMGFYYRKRSEYGPALDNTLRAQEAFTWLHDRINQVACLYNLGYIFSGQGNYPQALLNARQGLGLAEAANDQRWLILMNMQLGNISISLGEYDKARHYLEQGQRLAEHAHDQLGVSQGLRGLGQLYRTQGQWATARSYYEQDAFLAHRLGDNPGALVEESNIADMYERQGFYDAAFTHGRQVLRRLRQLDLVGYVPWAQLVLARAHLHTGRPDSAIRYAQASLLASQRNGVKDASRDAAEVLTQASVQQGNYQAAYRYQVLLGNYRDSLNSRELIRRTTALQYSYDLGQQQARIKLLLKDQKLRAESSRRQRQLFFALLAFLTVLGAALALLLRNVRHKQRASEQLNEANEQMRQLNAAVERQQHELDRQHENLSQTLSELRLTQQQLQQNEAIHGARPQDATMPPERTTISASASSGTTVIIAELVQELARESGRPTPSPTRQSQLLRALEAAVARQSPLSWSNT
jgi:two-component system NtrC family sensor kinase